MELRHLRYFLAVAEELHFGRAAKRLGIKQPPLSRQIKNLEIELNAILFDRTNRRVDLTPAGKYLRSSAASVVEQADRIRNAIGLIQEGGAGLVRIGYVGSAMHSVLPELLRTLRVRYPQIYPELTELDGDSQVRTLQSGELDIGFLRPPIRADGLDMHVVLEEPFALVLPSSHPLAERGTCSLDALADEPFIGFCRSCAPGMADQIVRICNDAGFSPRVVHETSQLNALLRLIESGFGYSIVPSSVRTGYDLNLTFRDIGETGERAQLAAIYHAQERTGPAETLVEMIRTRVPSE